MHKRLLLGGFGCHFAVSTYHHSKWTSSCIYYLNEFDFNVQLNALWLKFVRLTVSVGIKLHRLQLGLLDAFSFVWTRNSIHCRFLGSGLWNIITKLKWICGYIFLFCSGQHSHGTTSMHLIADEYAKGQLEHRSSSPIWLTHIFF